MPLVRIEIVSGKSPEYRKALMDGVHSALVEAFRIPENDRVQRLFELDREHFEIPSTKTDRFTYIEITAFRGRSFEAKKRLYAAVAANLEKDPGIKGGDLVIVLNDPPLEHWGLKGGKPGNEVDLGFKIDV